MSYTAADVASVIDQARTLSFEFANTAQSAASAAQLAAQGFASGLPLQTINVPGLRYVPAYKENVDLSSEIRIAYAEALRDIRPEFSKGLANYLATWFPQCIINQTDNWICDTILYGGTGIPPAIENAIWQRAREREDLEAKRMELEALTQLTTKGFTMPTGAVSARMLAVQQEAASKGASLSRDIAIKQAEMEIENIRLAVSEGIKVRVATLGAIGDYLRAWMLPETLAVEKAKAIASAKATLMNSAADYYRAAVSEAELHVRAGEAMAQMSNQRSIEGVQSFVAQISNQSQVGASIANAFGNAAASAAGSVLGVAQSTIGAVASV